MIYFDNAATTRPSEKALKKAEIYNSDGFFNPSALYNGGVENKKAVRSAKADLLSHISAEDHDLIFTSCGTESDNQAIFKNHSRGAVLTTDSEHAAVYNSVKELVKGGRKIFFAPVNADGSVKVSDLYETVKDNPEIDFVSIVHVCNETGAINDINVISENLKKINKKIIFHSDGVQAYGKIPYKIGDGVDLYSVSAHKINGLKGVGALIKRKSAPVDPLIIGGGQEDGFRSGTENVFGIKTFEFAASERYEKLNENFARASEIKKIILSGLDRRLFTVISGENCSPYIVSVSANGLKGEVIMHVLEEKGIIVGNGSACSSKNKFSRVIKACGYGENILGGVIRISSSPENTVDDAKYLVSVLNETAGRLKEVTYNV